MAPADVKVKFHVLMRDVKKHAWTKGLTIINERAVPGDVHLFLVFSFPFAYLY
jgi:hypothetical protein